MVYAFVIHTLFPGACKVLFYQTYGDESQLSSKDDNDNDVISDGPKRERLLQIEYAASQIHSEYQLRRSAANRSVEDDILALNQEDQLPEFELGFLRFSPGGPFSTERIAVWLGAGNTCFTLICAAEENRILAETVLKLLIRYLQEYVRVLSQPAEASLKADRVCLVLSKFLPDGGLVLMNHRVVRGLERELEVLMKA